MLQKVIALILGPGPVEFIIAGSFFALLGVVVSLLYSAAKRDQNKPETPDKFSQRYLLKDNSIRIALALVMIFISLRFSVEFLGAELTMWGSFLIGLAWDRLANRLKDKGWFDYINTR